MSDWPSDMTESISENPYRSPLAPPADRATMMAQPRYCDPVPPRGSRGVVAAVCLFLCLSVILIYCQTGGYDFVNFDDDQYVYDNVHIKHGLTWEGL